MDSTLSAVKYQGMRWNSPLSEDHAFDLLNHLDLSNASSLVDIGCGWGELLLRAIQKSSIKGTGIDNDAVAIARGQSAASDRSLSVNFVNGSAQEWKGTAGRAMCIGSSHTLGGTRAMLERLAEIVPTGKVLVGDTIWEKDPSDAAVEMMGYGIPKLTELAKMCRETGWQILHLSVADQREWDDFESSHRKGLREWTIQNPDDPRVEGIRKELNEREDGYLGVYRGVMGFAYLILAR